MAIADWLPPAGVCRLGFTVGFDAEGLQMDYASRLALVRGGAGLGSWTPFVAREFEPFNRGGSQIAALAAGHAARGVGMVLNTSAKLIGGAYVEFAAVIAGDYDAEIVAHLAALQAAWDTHGLPQIYTWFHEPYAHAQNNAPPGATKAEQAALYIACYEHIRVLRDIHAGDVALLQQSTEWQWQPSQGGGLLFWPGGDVVDIAAYTGTNAYNAGVDKSWKLPSTLRTMAATIETLGVPVAVMAAGTSEYVPGALATNKAAWYGDIAPTVTASGQTILYIAADTRWPDTGRDNRIDTTPAALTAFQAVAADPRMSNTAGVIDGGGSPTRTRHTGMLGV